MTVEYTDTFGGEANYAWVERHTLEIPEDASNRTIMRRAKAAVGLTGVRGTKEDWGDMIRFKPHNMNTVMFVTFGEV